jgi:hypothetical protein
MGFLPKDGKGKGVPYPFQRRGKSAHPFREEESYRHHTRGDYQENQQDDPYLRRFFPFHRFGWFTRCIFHISPPLLTAIIEGYLLSARLPTWMVLPVDFLKPLPAHMRIYLCGRDIRMTKHNLHGTQIGPPFEQVGSK